jgi:excisionase family DNA binding protein
VSTDPTATTERKLTAAQAADRLGLSQKQVHDLCREGVLAHFRYGRAVRIALAEVDRYLAASFVPAKPEGKVA